MNTQTVDTKFKVGKTYKARGGFDVKIVHIHSHNTFYPLVGILYRFGNESTISLTKEGTAFAEDIKFNIDLILPTTTQVIERWTNVYQGPLDTTIWTSGIFQSEEEARNEKLPLLRGTKYLGPHKYTITVTVEED